MKIRFLIALVLAIIIAFFSYDKVNRQRESRSDLTIKSTVPPKFLNVTTSNSDKTSIKPQYVDETTEEEKKEVESRRNAILQHYQSLEKARVTVIKTYSEKDGSGATLLISPASKAEIAESDKFARQFNEGLSSGGKAKLQSELAKINNEFMSAIKTKYVAFNLQTEDYEGFDPDKPCIISIADVMDDNIFNEFFERDGSLAALNNLSGGQGPEPDKNWRYAHLFPIRDVSQ